MTLVLTLVVAVVLIVVGVLLLRLSIRRRVRESIRAQAPENLPGGRTDSGKVAQVAQAYSRGEIDESTVKAAAKVLGISTAEATRRLDAAAQQPDVSPETQRSRSVTKAKQVDARRKKNAPEGAPIWRTCLLTLTTLFFIGEIDIANEPRAELRLML